MDETRADVVLEMGAELLELLEVYLRMRNEE